MTSPEIKIFEAAANQTDADKTAIENQDKELKNELTTLMNAIDIAENSTDKVDALFWKLNTLDEAQKTKALQYALRETEITLGSWGKKKLGEMAALFEKAVEQDDETWKLKVKDSTLSNDEKALIEPYLNQRNSSLAYLIQKSSNFAKIQAQRGYGKTQTDLIDIGEDKILGNQTRRALNGLQDWIESDLNKESTENLKNLTLDIVLGMKFISKSLKEKIEASENEEIKNLWNSLWDENSKYELKRPYTNNYALKEKNPDSWTDDASKKKETVKIGDIEHQVNRIDNISQLPLDTNKEFKRPENSVYVVKIGNTNYQFFNNGRYVNLTNKQQWNTADIVATLSSHQDYEGKIDPINTAPKIKQAINKAISIPLKWYYLDIGNTAHQITITTKPHTLCFTANNASVEIPLKKFMDKDGSFVKDYWNLVLLPEIQAQLINKIQKQQQDAEHTNAVNIVNQIKGNKYAKKDIMPEVTNTNKVAIIDQNNWNFTPWGIPLLSTNAATVTIDNKNTKAVGNSIQITFTTLDNNISKTYKAEFPAHEIMNNWEFDEQKLKEKLKKTIEDAIENK